MPNEFPFVVWKGKAPIDRASNRLFRLVHRGPARPGRPGDVPFAVEQRVGFSAMKRTNWAAPDRESGGEQEAARAVGHALGLVLTADPGNLVAGHPICCELNMAVVEGRESRGCDCAGPAEPGEGPGS